MTDTRVKEIIREQVAAAITALKKERCPHCGVAIGADKVAKSKSVTESFFDAFYGAPVATPKPANYSDLFK